MVKFQYISDIHLEMLTKIPVINKLKDVENICLLGDIGIPGTILYNKFIEQCSEKFENVFIIYGNHEYYNKIYKKKQVVIETIYDRIEYSKLFPHNVHFLNNSCVYLDKITNQVTSYKSHNSIKIIGSTLWSQIDIHIADYINDYKLIYTQKDTLLTPQKTIEYFIESKDYILNEINSDINIECIVLTHHGSNNKCNGEYYKTSHIKSGYVTHISELLNCNNLKVCINGHTHCSIKFIENDILFLANCYGYPGERKEIVCYDKDAIFSLD